MELRTLQTNPHRGRYDHLLEAALVRMATDLLEQTLPHIQSHIYPIRVALPSWKMKEGDFAGAESPRYNDNFWKTITLPIAWGGYGKVAWLRTNVTLGEQFSRKPVVLLLDFPESLLFLNGRPLQGIGPYHQEVVLTSKARANQSYVVAIQSTSGRSLEPTSFARAEVAVLYPPARTLFYALKALKELEQFLGASSADGKVVKELIRRTLIYVKYFHPAGEEYPNAIARALNFLTSTLTSEISSSVAGLIHLLAHAYFDPAWLWPLAEGYRKEARTFSTVLQYMEEYPNYKFTHGPVALLEAAAAEYPALLRSAQKCALEGRFEPAAPTWTEPDFNLVGGEAIVRQILYGTRFLREHFPTPPQILWAPASLGFCWSLPQLMQKSGLSYLLATRAAGLPAHFSPGNTFWWEGIDHSRVLVHLSPSGPRSSLSPKQLKLSWDAIQQKASNATNASIESVLHLFSAPDGSAPTKEQIELSTLLKSVPGLPSTVVSTAREFFLQLQQQSEEIPIWNGELAVERFRGVFTVHAWLKRQIRECEILISTAELYATLSMLAKATAYPQREFDAAWKKLLLHQHHRLHDGVSIAEAYEDSKNDLRVVRSVCEGIISRALATLTSKASKRSREFTFTVFNQLGWSRSEYVEVTIASKEKDFAVFDSTGEELPSQIIERQRNSVTLLCYVRNVPAYSTASFVVRAGVRPSRPSGANWKVGQKTIETPFYRVRVDNKGGISSLYDKQLRRELIKKGKRGNLFQTFLERSKAWEAWEIDPEFESRPVQIFKLKSARLLEKGPARLVYRLEYRSGGPTRLLQDLILYSENRRIDFITEVRWFEKQTLLKVSFPFDIKSTSPYYEIPFGAIKRSSKTGTGAEGGRADVPALGWADISDARGGVSMLTDLKHGFDARDSTLRLSLIRSPRYPHPVDPAHQAAARVTDQGEHRFRYALLPHAGDWRKGETARRTREFTRPLLVVSGRVGQPLPSLVTVSHPNIVVETVKKAEDSSEVVLRLYEAHGEQRDVTLGFGFAPAQVYECDLLENPLQKLKLKQSRLRVKFRPFEIKTLRLTIRRVRTRR